MDREISWPFSWGQPASESSRDTDKLPQVTSTLWKQLSEDHTDNLSISSFTNTPSYRNDDITHSEPSTVSSSTQPLPPALGTWDKELFSYPLYKSNSQHKNPWDTSLSSTPASQGFTDLLSLGSLGSNKQSSTNYVMFKAGNEENIYPEFLREQETSNVDSGLLLPEQHDPTNQKQHVQPYSNLTNGTWDSDQCIIPLSDPSANVGGSNVHGMSNITPLEQLVTRLRQRQALQDIGNLSYSAASQKMQPPSAFQAPLRNDFASPLKTSLHNSESQYDIYNSQGTTATQPQKQNTDLIALMQELSVLSGTRGAGPSLGGLKCQPSVPATSPTKCCVFCKNNNYHSTFYKSHSLKDERGHCQCPVLRMYVCPLCSATGDGAHTLKYCPRNTVTHGDPISAGLPPGKVTNWREVANRMMARYNAHQ